MVRALKVVLIIFGVVEIIMGLCLVFFPDQLASMSNISDISGYPRYMMVSLGLCLIAPSVFFIIAARDPLRHINWVKFAILWSGLGAIGGLYAVIKGDVGFSQAALQIIMDAAFAIVFLVLYPFRIAKSGAAE